MEAKTIGKWWVYYCRWEKVGNNTRKGERGIEVVPWGNPLMEFCYDADELLDRNVLFILVNDCWFWVCCYRWSVHFLEKIMFTC
jgi:hypothetical protein